MKTDLATRYAYESRYVRDPQELFQSILDKTVVPHQLEVQPGPELGKSLCWLKCPYCYGGSSKNDAERLSHERYVDLLRQSASGPNGGIPKVIFAGYATDPLYYGGIEDLLEVVVNNGQVFGFHTKALKLSERMIQLLTREDVRTKSYFSVSVDAGSAQSYASVHGIETKADLYSKVLANLRRLTDARAIAGIPLDISATYLITPENGSRREVRQAIHDLREAGVDLVRFSFPQVPRGHEGSHESVPERDAILRTMERLAPLVEAEDSERTRVVLRDMDDEYGIEERRSFPCFARYVFPTIGFDGYLGNCSESAAPHFRDMSLGNLEHVDFWDAYYDYEPKTLKADTFARQAKMEANDCRCDRKEHVVNALMRDARVFDAL